MASLQPFLIELYNGDSGFRSRCSGCTPEPPWVGDRINARRRTWDGSSSSRCTRGSCRKLLDNMLSCQVGPWPSPPPLASTTIGVGRRFTINKGNLNVWFAVTGSRAPVASLGIRRGTRPGSTRSSNSFVLGNELGTGVHLMISSLAIPAHGITRVVLGSTSTWRASTTSASTSTTTSTSPTKA